MAILKIAADIGVGILLPLFILSAGIYFTKYLNGFYLLHPIRTVKLMLSREGAGKTSPLCALSVSLAGTLGVGNIVGTLFGVLSLTTIQNIVSSAGLDQAWWTGITIAAMLCLFLVIQSIVMARKKQK